VRVARLRVQRERLLVLSGLFAQLTALQQLVTMLHSIGLGPAAAIGAADSEEESKYSNKQQNDGAGILSPGDASSSFSFSFAALSSGVPNASAATNAPSAPIVASTPLSELSPHELGEQIGRAVWLAHRVFARRLRQLEAEALAAEDATTAPASPVGSGSGRSYSGSTTVGAVPSCTLTPSNVHMHSNVCSHAHIFTHHSTFSLQFPNP
jgi:hypothetical protein